MSIREKLLARKATRVEAVTIDGMDEPIYLRAMTARERDDYEREQWERSKAGKELENFRARLLVRCIAEADGKRVFADADADVIGELDSATVRQLFEHAAKMNGLDNGSADTAQKN